MHSSEKEVTFNDRSTECFSTKVRTCKRSHRSLEGGIGAGKAFRIYREVACSHGRRRSVLHACFRKFLRVSFRFRKQLQEGHVQFGMAGLVSEGLSPY